MSRLVRFLVTVIIAVAAVFLFAVVAVAVVYSPTYAMRWLVWQDADVGDFQRFPARTMRAAPEPYLFAEPGDPEAAAEAVTAALEATGAVGGDLDGFLEETDTQALIVIRDGELLLERYVGDFERDSIATSFSTAKSFLSALVGIAIGEGAIGSVDDPITEYLPELLERDERFGDITIRHLLDMSSGIHYEEIGLPNGDDALTYYFDDLERLALERTTIDGPPGERWLYNNYHPLLLGLMLERTTGMSVTDFHEKKIWQPMGAELDGSWSLDREDGLEKLESGINARPIDFAKLGQLYLDGGAAWDGTQVVPADWVELSTAIPEAGPEAGYYPPMMDQPFGSVSHRMLWWHVRETDGEEAFSAVGNHGQYIYVSPGDRLVIVRSGREFGISTMAWLALFGEVADAIQPGISGG